MQKSLKGFNGFQLKIIALILMTLDHIHYAMSTFVHAPILLTQLGRLSAPIFIFLSTQGLLHTRNRNSYLKRLYLASLLMAIGNILINHWLPLPGEAVLSNNIFATLWIIGILVSSIESAIIGFKDNLVSQRWRAALGLSYILVSILVYILALNDTDSLILKILISFAPNVLAVEGSIIWVGLGVGLYFVSNDSIANTQKKSTKWIKLALFYTLFCIAVFYLTTGLVLTADNLLQVNFQWLMIGSLPFLISYNGQKGPSIKWLFYIYYPLHIYLLAAWAHFCA